MGGSQQLNERRFPLATPHSMFVLTYPPDEIPEAIIGFARLMIEEEAWEKARDKGKVPKPKIERTAGGVKVIQLLLRCIEIRREAYTCSLKVGTAVECIPLYAA